LNGAATPDKVGGFYDATVDGGFEISGEPYTVAAGTQFLWWRARMLGGRTNHWGRITLRYGPFDFRTYSREGLGVDWPIAYEDIAPYYTMTGWRS
jgi:choline dehydrogenase-like flavoprotein